MVISINIVRHLLSKVALAGYAHLLRETPGYAELETVPSDQLVDGQKFLDIIALVNARFPEGRLAYEVEYERFHTGQLNMLGALGQLVQVADHVGDMVQIFFGHYTRYNQLFEPKMAERGDVVVFTIEAAKNELWESRGFQVLVEMFLYGSLKMMRDLFAEPHLAPENLSFPYRLPNAEKALMERVFGQSVLMGSGCKLTWPKSLLERPLPFANPPLKKHLEHFLTTRPKDGNLLEQRVRELITDALPKLISLEEAADILHLGVRTMQRHLRQSGTSFQSLQNEERKHRALQLLEAGILSLKETAHSCGFADSNSFFRTFKKWTGQSPGNWKKTNSLT